MIYRLADIPVTQLTVSKHWRKRRQSCSIV